MPIETLRARARIACAAALALSLVTLLACSDHPNTGAPTTSNPPADTTPEAIQGVATPSSVAVVTATNAQ